ncbi:MAG: 50S ribosomal protein L4 [Patescibacteria group bacterium]|nr:50S ribosomal protein L4 [Patescibacteria group bacterium]
MKTVVYNKEGKETESTLLPKDIFEIKMNEDLVHQVAVSQIANRRKIIAKTKDRSEVRGGGRKPWQQKGTGRARVGSNRSPIWKGGGVTFGPRTERVFKKRIPTKMRRKALFMILSAKAKDNLIFVLDSIKTEMPKTKPMAKVFSTLFLKNGSGLVVLAERDLNTIKSIRNIAKVGVIQAKDLNPLDLLSYKYLIVTKESLEVIKKTFLN